MATVDVECSECGAGLQVEESLVGSSMTCPKCKLPCVVERPGAYDLVDEPRARPGRSSAGPAPDPSPGPGPGRPRAASPRPEEPETQEQRKLRERMERWSDEG
ncbi:hypothetical protein [Tautonia plasticadhaerens]|uniref:Uncharacterized protein n=1 Tax=Tautonia plasticadhaerens TaxID=2527974 RepID=A0A518HCY8_9BACT|nr:hypothetical protein [Tautonia plasticadhaerens]QDV38727.1 hypothetical protein ElP_66830 [Tautonia plasticadhaerens]